MSWSVKICGSSSKAVSVFIGCIFGTLCVSIGSIFFVEKSTLEFNFFFQGGWTPLMWASYKGHYDTVVILLERNADVNAHGNYHISSLLWAAGRGHTDIAKLLLKRGAKVNVGDKVSSCIWTFSSIRSVFNRFCSVCNYLIFFEITLIFSHDVHERIT